MFHTAGWRSLVYLFEYYGLLGGGDDEILHTTICCHSGNTGNLYLLPEVGSLPAESDLWSKCIKAIQKRRKFSQRCGDFLFLLFPVKSGSVNSQRAGSFTELSFVFVNDSLNILQAKGSA